MPWRIKSFFADAHAEDYLNSVRLEPAQLRDVQPVVQGPRTGLRLVCWLEDSQLESETKWLARTQTARPDRGSTP